MKNDVKISNDKCQFNAKAQISNYFFPLRVKMLEARILAISLSSFESRNTLILFPEQSDSEVEGFR